MRKTVIIFNMILFFSVSLAAAEDLTPEKRADIEKLIRITGSIKIAEQMANTFSQQMTGALKTARPDIPDRLFKILDEEVRRVVNEQMVAKGGFLDMVIPIYSKHFTHKDIKGLLAFYETELGRKTIRVLPYVMQECIRAGQLWGQALAPLIQERVIERFKEEGVDLTA